MSILDPTQHITGPLGTHHPEPGWNEGLLFEETPGQNDQRIHADILRVLQTDPDLDAREILIFVENREVFLSGRVPGKDSKKLAETLCEQIVGVREVHNMLKSQGII